MLKGKSRHELACSSCGAPLHDLKMLRKERSGDRETVPANRVRTRPPAQPRYEKPKKRKRRKSLMKKVFEEAFDVIEDIFD